MTNFKVNEGDAGQRLDVFLALKLTEISRSSIKKLTETGNIKVNDEPAKSNARLKVDDRVSVNLKVNKIEPLDLPLIYEDKNVIVIDKPAGVLTHSKGAFNPEATVASFIAPKVNDLSGDRAGVVHRLDRATSGVIICAKNVNTQKLLQNQFSTRKVNKTYVAIIRGGLIPPEAVIDMPIERNPKKPQTFRAGTNGKPAQTHYKTVKVNNGYSLLELRPKTGRTHQLRVHLRQIGHPIVGDELYGGQAAERLFLHALTLELTLPNGERKTFTAALPEIFNAKINAKWTS